MESIIENAWILRILFVWATFFSSPCFGQLNTVAREDFAEMMAAQSSFSDQDWQDFTETIHDKSVIDINLIGEEEMISWGILSSWQIQQFFSYRQLLGNFIHVNELQAIPGWHPALIKMLQPLFTIQQPVFSSSAQKKFKLQPILRTSGVPFLISGSDSLATTDWLGDRCRLLLQLRAEYAGVKMGITAKKDPGEPIWKKGIQRGFSYYGFHAFWQGRGVLKTMAVGDYTINLGQGLIHWQTMALRKSGEIVGSKRQAPVVKPHRGGGEFNFHRGVAWQIQWKKWELTGFISRRKITASIDYDSLQVPQHFRSINTSGYHRTAKEIANKNNLTEGIGGIRLARYTKKLSWGINGLNYQYSLPWARGYLPYQQFKIEGSHWQNASVDFSLTHKNAHFFGELAIDKCGKKALLAGLLLSVDSKADLSFVIRALSKEYQSLYANAFTENTIPSNEVGFFITISLRPSPRLQLNIYNDFYQFPWLRYQVSMPSQGRDHYLQLTYQPSRNTVFLVRLRQEQKPEDSPASTVSSPFPSLRAPVKTSARFHWEKKLNRELQLRFRIEMLQVKNATFAAVAGGRPLAESEAGYLSYWEYRQSLRKLGATWTFRVQYYDTDSYKSRIYSFLSDPGSSFSVSASYGKGVLVGAFLTKKLKNNWLVNLSLLLKSGLASTGIQFLPGVRVGWNL